MTDYAGFFAYLMNNEGKLNFEKIGVMEMQSIIATQSRRVYWFTPLTANEMTVNINDLQKKYPLEPAITELIKADVARAAQAKKDEAAREENEKKRLADIKVRLAQEQKDNDARRDTERKEAQKKADDAAAKSEQESMARDKAEADKAAAADKADTEAKAKK